MPSFSSNLLNHTNSLCNIQDHSSSSIQGARHAQFGLTPSDIPFNNKQVQPEIHLFGFQRLDQAAQPVRPIYKNDNVEYCISSWQDYSHLSDSHESIQETKGQVFHATNGIEEYCNFCQEDYSHLSDTDDSNNNSSSCMAETSLVNEEFGNSSQNSYIFHSRKEDVELGQPLPSLGFHVPQPAIPVGPRFQAEIPQREGITSIRQYNMEDNSKWFANEI
ncbi:hypothetical protein RIF29_29261 [Crotalaria pallida]|uniref:Uncharacterized protein n=1 Tax=Crotalaria pallida TaxID=3830 RepID=A0AAN9EEN5_CROPI